MEYVAGDGVIGSSLGMKPYQAREIPEVTTESETTIADDRNMILHTDEVVIKY